MKTTDESCLHCGYSHPKELARRQRLGLVPFNVRRPMLAVLKSGDRYWVVCSHCHASGEAIEEVMR